MAKVPTLRAGEAVTANYGWVKPTVGASADAWGGYINTDLDGIDSTVKSVSNAIPGPSLTTPAMDGAAAIGAATTYARADHVHPIDTSRAAVTDLPSASAVVPLADGVGAVGVSAAYARADHVHPITVTNPNRLDNGDMWVDQHNAGASVAVGASVNVWTPDRWVTFNTKAKFTVGQNYATVLKAPNFPYFLGVQTTGTGAAPAAADVNYTAQGIEFDTFNDFAWGTANALPATLSFWVNSSLTGNFSVAITGNVSPFRVFITTYNVPTANTWAKITIPIPADTTVSATNWTGAGNAPGLFLLFDFGSGANVQTSTSLGAWQNSATVWVASGAVKLVATSNAKWAITGVKLEAGSVATPYPVEDLARKLARCQRYYQVMNAQGILYGVAGAAVGQGISYNTSMRASPTINVSGVTQNNGTAIGATPTISVALIYWTTTTTGAGQLGGAFTASAEI